MSLPRTAASTFSYATDNGDFPARLRKAEASASKISFPDLLTVQVRLFWWGLGFLGPHSATELLQRLEMIHVMFLFAHLVIEILTRVYIKHLVRNRNSF